MELSRRECLALALAAGVGLLAGCRPLRRAMLRAQPSQTLASVPDLPAT